MALFRPPGLWIFDTLSLEDRLPLAQAYLGQLNWPLRRCTCLLAQETALCDYLFHLFFSVCIICPVRNGLGVVLLDFFLFSGVCIFFGLIAGGIIIARSGRPCTISHMFFFLSPGRIYYHPIYLVA